MAKGETRVTMGGAPVYVWPGGGITVMVDVTRMPRQRLRLRADAGHRRAHRVHAAARLYERPRRARRPISSPSTTSSASCRPSARIDGWQRRQPVAVRRRQDREHRTRSSARSTIAMTQCPAARAQSAAPSRRTAAARGARPMCWRSRSASCCAARTSARARCSTPSWAGSA